MTPALDIVSVGPERAADVVRLIHAAFGARPVLDPPATATDETTSSVAEALTRHSGILAVRDGAPVGAMLLGPEDDRLRLRRVSVEPSVQAEGVAGAMVAAAEQVAGREGYSAVVLTARAELPATVEFWRHRGYAVSARDRTFLAMGKCLPVTLNAESADDTRNIGRALGTVLRAGDVVILTGDLGAGKTTLTQGLGEGLGVRGAVTSPTFVISRVHPSTTAGPALVHVDAYRLGGIDELDDLDLDTSLDEAVTVVEWGEGVAEGLAEDRLEVTIRRSREIRPEDETDPRRVELLPVGARWIGAGLREALA